MSGRKGGETRRGADVDDLLAFFFSEGVGWNGAVCGGASVAAGWASKVVFPACEGSGAEADDFGAGGEAGAVLSGGADVVEEILALIESC